MNGFWSVVLKEAMHLRRDPTSLVLALLMPLIQITIFGFAIDFDVRHIATAIVDQDRTRESRQYIESLRHTQYIDPDIAAATPDDAAQMLRSGQVRAAIIIPPSFARDAVAGGNPKVGLLLDGSDSTVATRVRMAFSGSGSPARGTPIVRTNVLFNPDMKTQRFMIPGLIGLVMQLVTVALTSFSMVREKEQGTLEQLMVTPVGKTGLMLGKIAPYAVLALAELTIVLLAGNLIFDVHVVGSTVWLVILSLPFMMASLALGLFISTVAQNQAQALQLSILTLLPSVLMSGFAFPRDTMPGPLWLVSEAIPLTHYMQVVRGIVVRGAGPLDVLPSVIALLIIGTVLVTLSVTRFRKSVA